MSRALDKYMAIIEGGATEEYSQEELDKIAGAKHSAGGLGQQLAAGAYQGVQSVGASVEGVKAVWYDYIGNEEARDEAVSAYEAHNARGDRFGPDIKRIEDINSAGDFASWVAGTAIGANLPFAAALITPGGIAGGVAKQAASRGIAKQMAKRIADSAEDVAIKNIMKSQGLSKTAARKAFDGSGAQKKLLRDTADKLRKGTADSRYQKIFDVAKGGSKAVTGGRTGGLLGSSVAIETGLIGGEMGAEHGNIDTGTALKYGAVSGSIGALGASRLVNRALKGTGFAGKKAATGEGKISTRAKTAAKYAYQRMKDGGFEGGTEAAQELMNIYAMRESRGEAIGFDFTPDEVSQLANAAAAGGVAGGSITAATDAVNATLGKGASKYAEGIRKAARDAKENYGKPVQPGDVADNELGGSPVEPGPKPGPQPESPPVPTSEKEITAQLDNMESGGRAGVLVTKGESLRELANRSERLKEEGYQVVKLDESNTSDPGMHGFLVYDGKNPEAAKLIAAGRFEEIIGQPSTGRPENVSHETPAMTTRDADGTPVLDTQVDQTNIDEATESHDRAREASGGDTEVRTTGDVLQERAEQLNMEEAAPQQEYLVDSTDPQNMKVVRNPKYKPGSGSGETEFTTGFEADEQLAPAPVTVANLAQENLGATLPGQSQGAPQPATGKVGSNPKGGLPPNPNISSKSIGEDTTGLSDEDLRLLAENETVTIPGEIFIGTQAKNSTRKTPDGRSVPYRRASTVPGAIRRILADPWYQENYPPYNPKTKKGIWEYIPVQVLGGYKINIRPHAEQRDLYHAKEDRYNRQNEVRGLSDTVNVAKQLSDWIIVPFMNNNTVPEKVAENPDEYIIVMGRGYQMSEDGKTLKGIMLKQALHVPSIVVLGRKLLSAQANTRHYDDLPGSRKTQDALATGLAEIAVGENDWSRRLSKASRNAVLDAAYNPNLKVSSDITQVRLWADMDQEALDGEFKEDLLRPEMQDNEEYLFRSANKLRSTRPSLKGKRLRHIFKELVENYVSDKGATGVLSEQRGTPTKGTTGVSKNDIAELQPWLALANGILATGTIYYTRIPSLFKGLAVSEKQQPFIYNLHKVITAEGKAEIQKRFNHEKAKLENTPERTKEWHEARRRVEYLQRILDYAAADAKMRKNVESYKKARQAASADLRNQIKHGIAAKAYATAMRPLMEKIQQVAEANTALENTENSLARYEQLENDWEENVQNIQNETRHTLSEGFLETLKENTEFTHPPKWKVERNLREAEAQEGSPIAARGKFMDRPSAKPYGQEAAELAMTQYAKHWHTLKSKMDPPKPWDVNDARTEKARAIAELEAYARVTHSIMKPEETYREDAFKSKREKTLERELDRVPEDIYEQDPSDWQVARETSKHSTNEIVGQSVDKQGNVYPELRVDIKGVPHEVVYTETVRTEGPAGEAAETYPGGPDYDQGTEHMNQLGQRYSTKKTKTPNTGKQKDTAEQQKREVRDQYDRDTEIEAALFDDMADGPDIHDTAVTDAFMSQFEAENAVSTFGTNPQVKQVNVGGVGSLDQRVGEMISSLHKMLGIKNPVIILDAAAVQKLAGENLDNLIQNYHASSTESMKAALKQSPGTGAVTLMPRNDQSPIIIGSLDPTMEGDFIESMAVMSHEMGHVLFNTSKKALKNNKLQFAAMEKKYMDAVHPTRRDVYTMDEWMGDQFALTVEDMLQNVQDSAVKKDKKKVKAEFEKRLMKYPPFFRNLMRGLWKIWSGFNKYVNEYRRSIYENTGQELLRKDKGKGLPKDPKLRSSWKVSPDETYSNFFQTVVNTQRSRNAAVAAYKRALRMHPLGRMVTEQETVQNINAEIAIPRSEYEMHERRESEQEENQRIAAEKTDALKRELEGLSEEVAGIRAEIQRIYDDEQITNESYNKFENQLVTELESDLAMKEARIKQITEMAQQDARQYARGAAAMAYRTMQRANNDPGGSPIVPIRWRGSAEIIDPQHFSMIDSINQGRMRRRGAPNAIMKFASDVWTKHFVTVHKLLHKLPGGDAIVELLEKESGKAMTQRQKDEGIYEHAYHRRMGKDISGAQEILAKMSLSEYEGLAMAMATKVDAELTPLQIEYRDYTRDKAEKYRQEQIAMRSEQAHAAGLPPSSYNAAEDSSVLQLREHYWPHMYRTSMLDSEEGRSRFYSLMDRYVRRDWRPVNIPGHPEAMQWEGFKEYALKKLINETSIEQIPDANETASYAWQNAKQRLYDIPTAELLDAGMIASNPNEVNQYYYRNSARVIEWEKRFGGIEMVDVESLQDDMEPGDVIGKMRTNKVGSGGKAMDGLVPVWNSNLVVKNWLDSLEATYGPEMASDGKFAMDAIQGKIDITGFGRDTKIRFAKDVFLLAAHAILLPLALFASLADAGVMISRHDGGAAQILNAIRNNFTQAWTRNPSDLHRMAKSYGIISERAAQHALNDVGEAGEFGAVSEGHRRVQRWQDKFFQLNGLEQWTTMTRLAATELALDFMKTNGEQAMMGDATAQARLDELGITVQDIQSWDSGGRKDVTPEDKRVVQAIQLFVDESVMRPGATRRPATASDPIVGLLHSLHQFMYLFKTQLLDRMMVLADGNGIMSAQFMRAAAPLVYLFPIAMFGLFLRDAIYYAGDEEPPERSGMDILSRTGILGPLTMVYDALFGFEGGSLGDARRSLMGAAPGVAVDALQRHPVKTAAKLIPHAGTRKSIGGLVDG